MKRPTITDYTEDSIYPELKIKNTNHYSITQDIYIDQVEHENKELIKGIKEIAHIDDKYCHCLACKIADKFNLKTNKK